MHVSMLARTGNLVKDMKNDFRNYAVNHLGMSSNTLDSYARHMEKTAGGVMVPTSDYMNPYILEERQLNVTQMDVFSRLMMDRIIFLGTQVSDQSANIIQAQLLYLDSVDPEKDIALYINSPGGCVYAGLGIYLYHRTAAYDRMICRIILFIIIGMPRVSIIGGYHK